MSVLLLHDKIAWIARARPNPGQTFAPVVIQFHAYHGDLPARKATPQPQHLSLQHWISHAIADLRHYVQSSFKSRSQFPCVDRFRLLDGRDICRRGVSCDFSHDAMQFQTLLRRRLAAMEAYEGVYSQCAYAQEYRSLRGRL